MTFHIFDKQDLKIYGLDYKGITFGFYDVVEYIDEYNEMICWCKQNFGNPIDVPLYLDGIALPAEQVMRALPARQRWYKRYANELWFRDEQDYLWFLLRWA